MLPRFGLRPGSATTPFVPLDDVAPVLVPVAESAAPRSALVVAGWCLRG